MLSVGRINWKPKTGGTPIPYLQRQTCELPWRPPRGENIKIIGLLLVHPSLLFTTDMSSQQIDIVPSFSPLLSIKLPSPAEYHKRKVALISGQWHCGCETRPSSFLCSAVAFGRLTFCTALRYHRPGWLLFVCYDYTPFLVYIVADHC